MPFGDMMDGRITTSSGGANEKFTGHEFDDKVNLYYMQWRRYIPRFGVFTSVDPLTDVFPSWSPYNYAMNNPLIFIDPDGRSPVCGAYQNCDNTYEIGSIVSNRLGSWQYMGNDQWETLSLAENVTEITSTVGHAWHWFTNTLDEFYNFGDRTIAENKFNVISISVMDNPGAWLVGGLAVGSLARGTGAMATKGVGNLAIRSDIVLSGGRSGQLVKTLTGPANSVVKGGQGRIFITDKAGKVVWDITKDRAKSVIPGQGFGPKVAPTQEQLNLLKQVWGN
jgi:RHS repeat-associated protein